MQNDNQMVQDEALFALGSVAYIYKVLPTCIYFWLNSVSTYVVANDD